ncbi:hypothetical protein A9978_31725 [Pseudomonas sp. UMC65]|uniref:hypothetical protein n=1 Tax=Pseudomonas TaxID=286 RepID=UPI0016048B06|nr:MULTISPECIES: hypothetical protein [Pseudomonas]MBB1617028.1 hypothetical protein [Pseudomonas sp. UMC65]MBB1623085.1 hypothetical protein [Pseudomonas sp. UME65]UVL69964.1 hypothetical protein LOY23_18090 [Pseudomonas protegens]
MALLDYVKYDNGSETDKRALAVNAALELIAVRITNNTTGGILESELSRLSGYADTIQSALKTK